MLDKSDINVVFGKNNAASNYPIFRQVAVSSTFLFYGAHALGTIMPYFLMFFPKIETSSSPGIVIEHRYPGFGWVFDDVTDEGFQIVFISYRNNLDGEMRKGAGNSIEICVVLPRQPFEFVDKTDCLFFGVGLDDKVKVVVHQDKGQYDNFETERADGYPVHCCNEVGLVPK